MSDDRDVKETGWRDRLSTPAGGWRASLQASPFASLQKITRVAADAGKAAAQATTTMARERLQTALERAAEAVVDYEEEEEDAAEGQADFQTRAARDDELTELRLRCAELERSLVRAEESAAAPSALQTPSRAATVDGDEAASGWSGASDSELPSQLEALMAECEALKLAAEEQSTALQVPTKGYHETPTPHPPETESRREAPRSGIESARNAPSHQNW